MPLVKPPKPIPDQILSFDSGTTRNIQGRFIESSLNTWVVKVSEAAIGKFRSRQKTSLVFANPQQIFSGDVEVLEVLTGSCKLIVRTPANLFARPRRQHPRKDTSLPTAVIITRGLAAAPDTSNEFFGRRNNRILNISKSGALLATTTPLAEGIEEVLLLMGLDLDDPYSEFDQISVSATIMRSQTPTGSDSYPHGYGVKFKPMFPAFQYALDYFIDVILEEDPGQV